MGTNAKGNPWYAGTANTVPTDIKHQDIDVEDLCQVLSYQADNKVALQLYVTASMWLVGNPYNKAPQFIPFLDCSHELAQILLQMKADCQHPVRATSSILTTNLFQKLLTRWKDRSFFEYLLIDYSPNFTRLNSEGLVHGSTTSWASLHTPLGHMWLFFLC